MRESRHSDGVTKVCARSPGLVDDGRRKPVEGCAGATTNSPFTALSKSGPEYGPEGTEYIDCTRRLTKVIPVDGGAGMTPSCGPRQRHGGEGQMTGATKSTAAARTVVSV